MSRIRCKLGLIAMGCMAAVAQAQTLEYKFASSAPPTSPWAKQIDRTAAQVAEETKGAVKITPFYGSQLGSENDAIAQISRGRLDMGSFTVAAVALQVPEISLVNLPLFFDSQAQRDCVLDNHLQKFTTEALAKKNLVFINWGEVGPVHLPGKKAYATPADVKGIKVGVVVNKATTEFWREMGANPIPTNVAEVASSSQTGLIDTYPTPLAFYVPSGLNKVLPTLTKLPLWESAGVTLMNKGLYDKMPADLRASFDVGLRKTPVSTLRAEIRAVDTALTAAHKQAGGIVVEATPEQRAEWAKNLPPVWKEIAKDTGPEGEKFLALMEAGKKACPK
ncbi:MAG: TRAP transporter substrate-binding protein DctP [Burkholderiales bacterium]|jgi:TRAP-type C4-dicarboxylate transport system substrate-binding protein|nr:TRAP transporter substrate-binding protein DctP [Burkholderiales bacterium]